MSGGTKMRPATARTTAWVTPRLFTTGGLEHKIITQLDLEPFFTEEHAASHPVATRCLLQDEFHYGGGLAGAGRAVDERHVLGRQRARHRRPLRAVQPRIHRRPCRGVAYKSASRHTSLRSDFKI